MKTGGDHGRFSQSKWALSSVVAEPIARFSKCTQMEPCAVKQRFKSSPKVSFKLHLQLHGMIKDGLDAKESLGILAAFCSQKKSIRDPGTELKHILAFLNGILSTHSTSCLHRQGSIFLQFYNYYMGRKKCQIVDRRYFQSSVYQRINLEAPFSVPGTVSGV